MDWRWNNDKLTHIINSMENRRNPMPIDTMGTFLIFFLTALGEFYILKRSKKQIRGHSLMTKFPVFI